MLRRIESALRTRIVECTSKIECGNFDANDVRSVYGLLREKASADGYTKDIAHFFAHPDRDKGKMHQKLRSLVEKLTSQKSQKIKIASVKYDFIIADLNVELLKHDIPEIRKDMHDALALVLLSALQESRLLFPNNIVLSTHLYVFGAEEIALCGFLPNSITSRGVCFPIISMPNVFNIGEFMPPPDEDNWPILAVKIENGKPEVWQAGEPITVRFPEKPL